MTSEEKREYQRLYYQRNKDRILARCKKYKESHREELREKSRAYNRTHKEEIQQWASDNRESRLLTYKRHYQRHKYDRRLNKVRAIQYKGSKCSICGCEYDGTNGAIFDFHHVDPLVKDTEISKLLISPNFSDKLKEELDKCICVCSNCHRLLHNDKF